MQKYRLYSKYVLLSDSVNSISGKLLNHCVRKPQINMALDSQILSSILLNLQCCTSNKKFLHFLEDFVVSL